MVQIVSQWHYVPLIKNLVVIMELMVNVFILIKKDKPKDLNNVELKLVQITKIQQLINANKIKRYVYLMVKIVFLKINVKHIKLKLHVILVG